MTTNDAATIAEIYKHLAGQHNQLKHGKGKAVPDYKVMSDEELKIRHDEAVAKVNYYNKWLQRPVKKQIALGIAIAATGLGIYEAVRALVKTQPMQKFQQKPFMDLALLVGAAVPAAALAVGAREELADSVTREVLAALVTKKYVKKNLVVLGKVIEDTQAEMDRRVKKSATSSNNLVNALKETSRLLLKQYPADLDVLDSIKDLDEAIRTIEQAEDLQPLVTKHMPGQHNQQDHAPNKLAKTAEKTRDAISAKAKKMISDVKDYVHKLNLQGKKSNIKAYENATKNLDYSNKGYAKKYIQSMVGLGISAILSTILVVVTRPEVQEAAKIKANVYMREHKKRMESDPDYKWLFENQVDAGVRGSIQTLKERAQAFPAGEAKPLNVRFPQNPTPGTGPVVEGKWKDGGLVTERLRLKSVLAEDELLGSIRELIQKVEDLPADLQPKEKLQDLKELEVAFQDDEDLTSRVAKSLGVTKSMVDTVSSLREG